VTTETPMRRHAREMREAHEKLRAQRSLEQATVDAAFALTEKERDALSAADAAVDQAQEGFNAAGLRVAELEGRMRSDTYFESSNRNKTTRRVTRRREGYAEAREELPDARLALVRARENLHGEIRARNHTRQRIEAARGARRRQAKLAHTPSRPPAKRRGDPYTMAHPPEAA
jgi:hypothetical protein